MAVWQILLILIGFAIVILPLVIIAVSTSPLLFPQRTAYLVVYGGVLALVAVAGADAADWLGSRPLVDLVLLIGGLAVGAFGHWTIAQLTTARSATTVIQRK